MYAINSSNFNHHKIFQATKAFSVITLLAFGIICTICGSQGIPIMNVMKSTVPYIGLILCATFATFAVSSILVIKGLKHKVSIDSPVLSQVSLVQNDPITVVKKDPITVEINQLPEKVFEFEPKTFEEQSSFNVIYYMRQDLEAFFSRNVSDLESLQWQKHAKKSQNLILSGIENVSAKNIAWVFSPGELEPLKEIADCFESVILIGKSPKIKEKPLRFKTLEINFLENLFYDVDEIFSRGLPFEETEKALLNYVEKIPEHPTVDISKFPSPKPDFIVCSLIMSEFGKIGYHIYDFIKRRYEKNYKNVDLLNKFYNLACDQWISLLVNLTKSGTIIYFADTTSITRLEIMYYQKPFWFDNTKSLVPDKFLSKDSFSTHHLSEVNHENWLWTLDKKLHYKVDAWLLKKN